jgi:hypothetical protein
VKRVPRIRKPFATTSRVIIKQQFLRSCGVDVTAMVAYLV